MENNTLQANEGKTFELDLLDLQAEMARRQKRTDLSEFTSQIQELMRLDISLPVLLDWLERKGRKMTLTALRRYVVRTYGEEHYRIYVNRNGWKKTKLSATNESALINNLPRSNEKNNSNDVNKNKGSDVTIAGVTEIQQILNAPPMRYPPRKK